MYIHTYVYRLRKQAVTGDIWRTRTVVIDWLTTDFGSETNLKRG
jgi:hypothetical protein